MTDKSVDRSGLTHALLRLRALGWQRLARWALAIVSLLLLAGAALWLKGRGDEAWRRVSEIEAARLAGVMSLVATQQSNGQFAAAAALAASEPALPVTFRENALLARYESATLLDSARLPLGQSLDVEWLQAVNGTRPVLVSWGWSSGVNTIQVGPSTTMTSCGVMPSAPRIRLASDGRWFGVLNLPTHEAMLLPAPGCTQEDKLLSSWSTAIARQESRGTHLQAMLPLPGPRLLLGWADGRAEMLRGDSNPLPLRRFDGAVVGLVSNTAATAFALLSRTGRLALVDATGRDLAEPLQLQRDVLLTTREPAWAAFVHDADLPEAHALLLDQGAVNGRAAAVLGVLSKPESASFYLRDLEDGGPAVLDVAVAISPNDGCPHLELLTAERLASRPMDGRCGRQPAAPALGDSEIRLPVGGDSSADLLRGVASAAFCEAGDSMVLGTWHGELLWLRHIHAAPGTPARLDIEHAERSAWDDPVTALACRDDGSVQAGFQGAGIKAFRPRLHLQQATVGIRSVKDYAEVIAEDQAWPVDTVHGPARLEFRADSGELGLMQQGRLAWRRRLADPAPLRPEPGTDKVTAVLIDAPRARVWVLTTMGRLQLLELNTGAVLARFSTAFYAASPNKSVALERPKLDASGQLSFVHRIGETAMRVVVDDGNR